MFAPGNTIQGGNRHGRNPRKSSINNQNILSTPQHFNPSRLPNASGQFTPNYLYTPPPPFALPMGANGSMLPVSPMSASFSPFDTSGIQQVQPTSQVERMRLWRHDALMQHLYDTAAFWADKVLSMTGDANDVFWLAQTYYQTGEYTRAEHLLLSQNRLMQSVACRYLAAQCLIKLEKWTEALEILGDKNPFQGKGNSGPQVRNTDGGIKLEASMCYLRGKVYSNLGNTERSRQCYKEALTLDVKCYEAFQALISNNLLTSDEEWDFINSLNYQDQTEADAELIKSTYITKLRKYKYVDKITSAMQTLGEKYKLEENADVLLSKADLALTACNFETAFELTTRILDIDPYDFNALPIHIACMYELNLKNRLFLLSHDLSERYSEKAVSWFAVGVYYYSTNKNLDARRYFSKASVMDPNFGPAWIGFAHTFAVEGEHEQAISAYSTAGRLFQGMHLPTLYVGMQYLQQNNTALADEYLADSYKICKTDPLLLNEIGVAAYTKGMYAEAISMFETALQDVNLSRFNEKIWTATLRNLGHAYRRLGDFDKAREAFERALRTTPRDASIIATLGMMLHLEDDIDGAIVKYHEALSLERNDPIAAELLKKALDANETRSSIDWAGLPTSLIEETRNLADNTPRYETVDFDALRSKEVISSDISQDMSINMSESFEHSGVSSASERSSARELYGRFQAALGDQSSILEPSDIAAAFPDMQGHYPHRDDEESMEMEQD